jgi:hypothetical protein
MANKALDKPDYKVSSHLDASTKNEEASLKAVPPRRTNQWVSISSIRQIDSKQREVGETESFTPVKAARKGAVEDSRTAPSAQLLQRDKTLEGRADSRFPMNNDAGALKESSLRIVYCPRRSVQSCEQCEYASQCSCK